MDTKIVSIAKATIPMIGALFISIINDYAIGNETSFMEFMMFWMLIEIYLKKTLDD